MAEQVLDDAARPPGDEATLVDAQTGRLQIATRGPDGTPRWQGATALSRADLIRLAGIVQQQAEAPGTTKTVRIKRVLDRDPTTEHIRTVAEWEVEAPLAPSATTATVKIRRILDRDGAGDLQRVVEWDVIIPRDPVTGQPDLSALPPELPASR